MKITAVADLHIGHHKIDKIKVELDMLKDFLVEYGDDLDMFIICGDLFHKLLPTYDDNISMVLCVINDIIEISKSKNFIIRILKGTGEHEKGQLSLLKHFIQNDDLVFDVPRFSIINKPDVEIINNEKILYIPEEYMHDWRDYYSEFLQDTYKYIFFHGSMDFTAFPGELEKSEDKRFRSRPVFDSDMFSEMADVIIGGHIHNSISKDNIFYCGSFSRSSMSELSERGFIYIDDDIVSFVENEYAPKYIRIEYSNIKDKTPEEIKEFIADLKEEYDRVEIVTSRENIDIGTKKLLHEITEDGTIKVASDKVTCSHDILEYKFLLDKDLSTNDKISMYIKETRGLSVSADDITTALKDSL